MNEQLKNLIKLETIKFFDKDKNKLIEARFQGVDSKFGVFIRRLDDNEVEFIDENSIVTSSLIDKEMKKFDYDFSLNTPYKSCYNYLLSLQEDTIKFLKEKCKLRIDILERNWTKALDDLDYAYMIKDGVNKWGNSAKIYFHKNDIKEETLKDLLTLFEIHNDENNFCIYNLYLALEILSNKDYK